MWSSNTSCDNFCVGKKPASSNRSGTVDAVHFFVLLASWTATARKKESALKLNRFPRDLLLKRLWSWAIRRKVCEPNEYFRICGAHFMSGEAFSDIALSVSGFIIVLIGWIFYRWLDITWRDLKLLVNWLVEEWIHSPLPNCFDGDYRLTLMYL